MFILLQGHFNSGGRSLAETNSLWNGSAEFGSQLVDVCIGRAQSWS